MAAKKTKNKKAPSGATPKKSASQKGGAKVNKKAAETSKPKKPKSNIYSKIAPYLLLFLALVLGICLVTVHVAEMDDGVGVVGYYFQAVFCAVFGVAAYLMPLVFIFVGVHWCIYNIKWGVGKQEGDKDIEAIKARRALRRVKVTSTLVIICFSALFAIFAEQSVFDLLTFWEEGIDGIGGGVIGGSIGCLMYICFKPLLSAIILILALTLLVFLALGFTPDYIVRRLRERHIVKKQMQAEEAQRLEEYEQSHPQPDPTPVVKSRPEVRPAPTSRVSKKVNVMTVDELLDDELPIYDDPEPIPLNTKVAEKLTPVNEVPIGPSVAEEIIKPVAKEEQQEKEEKEETAEEPKSVPLDFGGDPSFDKNEYNSLGDIFKDLDTAPKSAPVADTKPVAEDKVDTPIDLSEIESEELLEDMAAVAPEEGEQEVEQEVITPYVFPPYDLLAENKDVKDTDYTEELQSNAKVLVETLRSFRVGIREVTYSRGPTITRYELKPEVGTRVRSIANLVDDIALNLATSGVRIEAPIPNKPAVGIEVPNKVRATVYLRDLIENNKFVEAKSRLTASLGMDVGGNPIYFDVAKMPHLLIAGTTGSGKSICINCIIISLLYKAKPEDVKLILIDPKKVEFNMYKNIPHLYCPIVSEPKKAAGALASAVAEMERRFELIEAVGVRDIASYNAATENDPEKEYMPQMVIIIDELADLMMTARDEVETSICRLAQKARAAGIHVILGTQRPSVDVITGLIKANVPSRIACTVTSQVDSRTIIDVAGAENLIGRGDMLFSPVGSSKPMRVQGAFVSDNEVEKIVSFISENNGKAKYNNDFINRIEEEAAKCGMGKKGAAAAAVEDMPEVEGGDSKFRDAVKLAIETGKISTSLMQRRLGVGYGRAAKMIDTMEQMGYVSAQDGNKPRQVLITMDEYMRRVMDGELGEVQD